MVAEDQFCSKYCESIGIECIGSARGPEESGFTFGGYILVEDNSYWDAKIENSVGILGSISDIIDRHTKETSQVWRIQAIQEFESTKETDDKIIIIIYRNVSSNENAYNLEKEVYELPSDEILKKVVHILKGSVLKNQILSNKGDILICTHTERDHCCSRFGYPIYKEIKKIDQENFHIWRSSHIGGHRTAPTILQFPSARYWGYMNPEATKKLVMDQPLTPEEIKYHYRGLAGLTPAEQLVEREGLLMYGIDWLNNHVRIENHDQGNSWNIIISSGENKVSRKVSKSFTVREIGDTKCAWVKPVKEFKLFE